MFSEISFGEWLILGVGSLISFTFIYFFTYKVKKMGAEVQAKEWSDDAQRFDAAFIALKQAIDHIETPILLIANHYAHSLVSVRNQIKKSFSLFSNSIAYEKNLYTHNHYDDVILDILRHPLFFQTIESYSVSPITEIEIHFELPKQYRFKLLLSSYEPSHILHNVLVVTLIDQSQSVLLNQMRSDFIAHASHELRTPLTSLDGFIQTLLTVEVDDEKTQKKFLEIMQMQVARMVRLTNGLLQLSRVERDEYRIITEQVNLKLVIQQVLQEIQFKTKQAEITLKYEDQVAAQEVQIYADRDQLFQIFHNLLENAMRYAPLGQNHEAQIFCVLSFSEDHMKWPGLGWIVSVQDNGPGIEKSHISRLTERFYRADTKNSGTGLGLAIVKHLVNRHKGVLLIESKIGCGSCFSVWFPMHYV